MANNDVEVLERGNIYFIYRPKVEEESPEGLGDVQRLHVVLGPEGEGRHRLITVGQKKLPKIGERGRQHFAFVDSVAGSPEDLERGLREDTYETKTRGSVPCPRPGPRARASTPSVATGTTPAWHTSWSCRRKPTRCRGR